MYIIELTDKYIIIYDKKNKKIYKEAIPYNVIVNNKIYDFIKLNKILYNIFIKHNYLSHIFKIKVNILSFEKITPSEKYLIKNLLNNLSNINIDIVYPSELFDDNHILISGNKLYLNNKELINPKNKEYIIAGYNTTDEIINKIELEYNIKLLKYENSTKTIYEKVI